MEEVRTILFQVLSLIYESIVDTLLILEYILDLQNRNGMERPFGEVGEDVEGRMDSKSLGGSVGRDEGEEDIRAELISIDHSWELIEGERCTYSEIQIKIV